MKCKICEQERDLRMGVCFTCAECESVIEDGTDMYDEPIEKLEGSSMSMAKLKYILKKYKIVNPTQP
jgi:hypothetical protein